MLRSETVDFSIDVKGELSGTDYKGFFSCLPRLSHRLTLEKDRKYREILGNDPGNASDSSKMLAIYLADFSVRLTKYPDWFRDSNFGADLEDWDVINTIAEKISDIIKKDQEALSAKAEKARAELKEIK